MINDWSHFTKYVRFKNSYFKEHLPTAASEKSVYPLTIQLAKLILSSFFPMKFHENRIIIKTLNAQLYLIAKNLFEIKEETILSQTC